MSAVPSLDQTIDNIDALKSRHASEFIRSLPESTWQAMVSDAARNRNISLLLQLERAGVFAIKSDHCQLNAFTLESMVFHASQFSVIAALACVAQGQQKSRYLPLALCTDQEGGSPPFMTLETNTAPQQGSMADISRLIGRQVDAMTAVAKRRMDVWGQDGGDTQESTDLVDDLQHFMSRFRATLDVLLCASAAMKDADLARTLCRAICLFDNLALSASGTESLIKPHGIFTDNARASQWEVSPAYLALCFDAFEVLDVMVEHGWRPLDAVLKIAPTTAKPPLTQSQQGIQRYLLADVLISDKTINFSRPAARKMLDLMKEGDIFNADCAERIRRWGEALMKRDQPDMSMVQMAMEMGVYHINPEKSYNKAVDNGVEPVVLALGDQLDWSVFTPKDRPIDLALTSVKWSKERQTMERITLAVMQHAVDAGRSDLLTEPGLFETGTGRLIELPLLTCMELDFAAGVLLCLESGADPLLAGNEGRNAYGVIEHEKSEKMANLLRSFLAKKQALGVMAELDGKPAAARFNA